LDEAGSFVFNSKMILLPMKNKKNEILFSVQIITEVQAKGRRSSL
jgi:hypothetical protein